MTTPDDLPQDPSEAATFKQWASKYWWSSDMPTATVALMAWQSRAALAAAPAAQPVVYVPYCYKDADNGVVGEYRFAEYEEKPFGMSDPEHWTCAPLYATPPAAPAAPAQPAKCPTCKGTAPKFCSDSFHLPAQPAEPATLWGFKHNGRAIVDANHETKVAAQECWAEEIAAGIGDVVPLYAAPPPPQPLTDEQIAKAAFEVMRSYKSDTVWKAMTYDSGPYDITKLRPVVLEIARAILAASQEQKHG